MRNIDAEVEVTDSPAEPTSRTLVLGHEDGAKVGETSQGPGVHKCGPAFPQMSDEQCELHAAEREDSASMGLAAHECQRGSWQELVAGAQATGAPQHRHSWRQMSSGQIVRSNSRLPTKMKVTSG